jgi:Ca2+-binding EF-hand superfamily protein
MTLSRTLGIAALAATMALGATGIALAERGGHSGMQGRGPMAGFDFATLDADGDGKITKEEMQAPRADRLASLDADGDGKISLAELQADHLRHATERAEQRAARMMAAMDGDGDGMLTAAELLAGPGPGKMFDRADTDGDGAISQAEADAMRDRMADRMARRGDHRGHGRMKHDN